jgi:hypothetical protein
MRRLRTTLIISCLPSFALAAFLMAERAAPANAQSGNQAQSGSTASSGMSRPIVVAADSQVTTAKVLAVDSADRTVVLQGDNGQEITLEVGKDARNLDQVKPGDTVKAQFITAAAVSLRKAEDPPTTAESQTVELAPRGALPGAVIVDTRQITATVDNVDYQNRMVTLTGPRANTESFKVGDNVENLQKVKRGDQVVVRYTEAVALSVEK